MATDQRTLDELAGALVAARPPMRPVECRTALALYRLLAEGTPVSDTRLAEAVGLSEEDALAALAAWPPAFRDDNGDIVSFLALSVAELPPHRYVANGVPLSTWCAWDAMFMTVLLDGRAEVESVDALTGEPISLMISPAGVERRSHPDAVVSLLSLDGKFHSDVFTTFCHYVHFFTSRENGERWAAEYDDVFLVSLDEAFELGRRFVEPILRGAADA